MAKQGIKPVSPSTRPGSAKKVGKVSRPVPPRGRGKGGRNPRRNR